MQIPRAIHAGDLLEIRRQRWHVLDVRAYEHCQLLTVAGVGAGNAGTHRHFLTPIEVIAPLDSVRSPRFVRPRRWRHACRELLAECTPPGGLRAARLARIELLPHQLEPALAIVRGLGSRVLLADDVGMGKTIQAGLIIKELQARGQADRILIVTPSGLRDQWRLELADRFAIAADVVDFREIRRRCLTVPVGLNPWITTPIAIASIDYVKRPEVLQSVRACWWDVVVLDEVHGAGRDSDRFASVSAIAARAAYVVLLTATPHSGDARAFASLCDIGTLDDALLVFRRTRAAVSLGAGRRVRRLHVRASAAESRMHALLADFTRAVRSEHGAPDAWLALSVLHKRAFSSARALELTVRRRLDALGPAAVGGLRQMALPLDAQAGEFDFADEPPDCLASLRLADSSRERLLLLALRDAAQRASAGETKLLVLRRLLRRVAEPIVIFTEFRDTLWHLRAELRQPALMLHGGLTRDERRAALDDFANGRCRILLATDAAGEGLNLHHRCRCLVNLELPWNPTRLEQRIGRVDRIGQQRRVHAIHLIARDTGESRVLDRLKARIMRAQQDIAAANPIEDDERDVARSIIEPDGDETRERAAGVDAEMLPPSAALQRVDLRAEADAEVKRLRFARAMSSDVGARAVVSLVATGPWAARTRLGASRARLDGRVLAILRIDAEDACGRLIDATVVAVTIALTRRARIGSDQLKALLRGLGGALQTQTEDASRRNRDLATGVMRDLLARRAAREKQIAQMVLGPARVVVQAGLFDRRAERAAFADSRAAGEFADGSASRRRTIERSEVVSVRPARLMLVLVP